VGRILPQEDKIQVIVHLLEQRVRDLTNPRYGLSSLKIRSYLVLWITHPGGKNGGEDKVWKFIFNQAGYL